MANRPGFTRWHAILLAGGVAIFLLIGLAAGTPFYDWVGLLSGAVVLWLGVSDWRAKGHGWLPTLSWAIPLGGLWMVIQLLFDGPKALAYWLGAVPLTVMLLSTRAATWWYVVVLRRPYKS